MLHHILDIASHLHDLEHDNNLSNVVVPMESKFLKYYKATPMLYAFALVQGPRDKLRGLHNIIELLVQCNNMSYTTYSIEVKTKLYKLYNKYVSKFGATWLIRESSHGTIFGGTRQIC